MKSLIFMLVSAAALFAVPLPAAQASDIQLLTNAQPGQARIEQVRYGRRWYGYRRPYYRAYRPYYRPYYGYYRPGFSVWY